MTTVRYELSGRHEETLEHWHYHGDVEDVARFTKINNTTRDLAEMIMHMTPPGRNQSLALTALEDVRMRANAAIAVDECIAKGGRCG